MDVVVLLGAPGAGKGTTAIRMVDRLGCRHLSTGQMLRSRAARGTPDGKQAEALVAKGELVPDALIAGMVSEQLAEGDAELYLLDGFPRTVRQAERLAGVLETQRASLRMVVLLDVPKAVLARRLSGRLVCSDCGMVYHVETLKPEREGVCDRCGATLVTRRDDQPETVLRRLDVYEERTAPLIAWYETRGLLKRVDGDRSPDEVVVALAETIEKGP